MATNGFVYALIIVVLLETAVANCQNCDFSSNVSLSTMEENICPMQPVTVQCNVTKPSDGGNFILSWQCTGLDGTNEERLAFCETGPVAGFICKFGEVYNVKGSCTCNETLITSEATFIATSVGDMLLFCSDGGVDTQEVSVSVKGLDAPLLSMNYTAVIIDSETYEVTVCWTSGNYTPDDVEYVVSFTNSKEIVTNTTNQTQISQILYRDTEYIVTVTAQRCGGNLSSEASSRLLLPIAGTSTNSVVPTTTITTVANDTKTEGNAIFAKAVGGSVAAVGAIIIILFICCTLFFCWKRHRKSTVEEPRNTNQEMNDQPDSKSRKHTGVAGLYVDSTHIYYSCFKPGENKRHIVRKCTHEGDIVWTSANCNNFIRGIGKDKAGYIYVLSCEQLHKFNNDLQHIKSENCARYFGEAFGMLVTSKYVLVCEKTKHNRINIFHLDLTFYFWLQLEFAPIAIARCKKKYFLTAKNAIGVVEIDFVNRKLKAVEMFHNMIVDEDSVAFKPDTVLRGIACTNDGYLYVTEMNADMSGGRLLCLQFNRKKKNLQFVCEVSDYPTACCKDCSTDCCPVVIVYYQDEIFYSKGSFDKNFHIVKANHSPGTHSTKLFDV